MKGHVDLVGTENIPATEASFRVTSLEKQLSFPRTLVQVMFGRLILIHDWTDVMLVERVSIVSHTMNSLLFILAWIVTFSLESVKVGERINSYNAEVGKIGLLLLFLLCCSEEKANEEGFVALYVERNRALSRL